MAIHECVLNLDGQRRELKPHGTPEFPCAGYVLECTDEANDEVPWHWHEEAELIYLHEGKLSLQTPRSTIPLHEGESAFVNSNILHHIVADGFCRIHSVVFHPALVGADTTVFAQKYANPLMRSSSLDCLRGPEGQEMTVAIRDAFEAMKASQTGYEFFVREQICRVCLFLYRQHGEEAAQETAETDLDAVRIRAMLDYIHAHSAQNLTLSQIARSANIGERECLRCFARTIRVSPMQYVLKYRIARGAELLEGSGSIAEISSRCGFDSPSNFSQLFRRFYKCTPREYRARIPEAQSGELPGK